MDTIKKVSRRREPHFVTSLSTLRSRLPHDLLGSALVIPMEVLDPAEAIPDLIQGLDTSEE